jgi:Tol biopolymer transport system component
VNEEPPSVQSLVPDAQPELFHIIRRALEKDPAERYQSAADMLIDLRRLKKDTSRSGFAPVRTESNKTISSRRNAFIIAGGVFVLICVVAYLIFIDRDVRVNDKFTQRMVQVPFKTVSAPSVSPDGKYLVFAGADINNKWQLYISGVAGGPVRQLTDDPDVSIGAMPSISPDGTSIVYHRTSVEGDDIVIIPFIGGTGNKIGSGNAAKWSPDGRRIGYLRMPRNSVVGPYSKSGRCEFWTMKSDGTDNRLEFIDTIATIIGSRDFSLTFSFAWSPDGKRVAWVRPLPQMYCEIVLHDLSTHQEVPLVTDTTWKNELCWGTNDQIIYSSRNFEGWNLWTVPAAGGEPVQVTRGSSYEDIPTISNDCRIVTFWQSGNTGFLKGVQLDGSDKHLDIASGDNVIYDWAAVSPDGRFVAFTSRTPFAPESHIQVINIDGTNQRQLTSGETYDDNPYWSPDGRMIAYNSRKIFEPPESTKVFILNFEKPETPRFVHSGTSNGWRDSVSLDVQIGARYWVAYLDERPPERPSDDSVFAISILGGQYTLYFDWRIAGGDSLRVCRTRDWDKKGPSNSWPIWNGRSHGILRDRGIYVFKSENELLRISFPYGKQERVPATFPGISLNRYRVRLTNDGLMMCYKVNKPYSKLGVIENLFK